MAAVTEHNTAAPNTGTTDTGHHCHGCLQQLPPQILKGPYFITEVASDSVCVSDGWWPGHVINSHRKASWECLVYFQSKKQALLQKVGDSPSIVRRVQDWVTKKNDAYQLQIINGSMAIFTSFSCSGQLSYILNLTEKAVLEFRVTHDARSTGQQQARLSQQEYLRIECGTNHFSFPNIFVEAVDS